MFILLGNDNSAGEKAFYFIAQNVIVFCDMFLQLPISGRAA